MIAAIIQTLKVQGHSVTACCTVPYQTKPKLSVASWELLFRRPAWRETSINGIRTVEIGIAAPEFEIPYYLSQPVWTRLIGDHDVCLAVSGNCLAAYQFYINKVPSLTWAATPYYEDKKDRTSTWPVLRKAVDRMFLSPIGRALEKQVLVNTNVLALSQYTAKAFKNSTRTKDFTVLPFPIDADLFSSQDRKTDGFTIGFSGRINDPRKNIGLLLRAGRLLKKKFPRLKIKIVGGIPADFIAAQMAKEGLSEHVEFIPFMQRENTVDFYRSLDVFVIPSFQEGLCIAALEAMSCGCPVVTTPCGGPEEYVLDGENGFFTTFAPESVTEKVEYLLSDQKKRMSFSSAAVDTIHTFYNFKRMEDIFWAEYRKVFK